MFFNVKLCPSPVNTKVFFPRISSRIQQKGVGSIMPTRMLNYFYKLSIGSFLSWTISSLDNRLLYPPLVREWLKLNYKKRNCGGKLKLTVTLLYQSSALVRGSVYLVFVIKGLWLYKVVFQKWVFSQARGPWYTSSEGRGTQYTVQGSES